MKELGAVRRLKEVAVYTTANMAAKREFLEKLGLKGWEFSKKNGTLMCNSLSPTKAIADLADQLKRKGWSAKLTKGYSTFTKGDILLTCDPGTSQTGRKANLWVSEMPGSTEGIKAILKALKPLGGTECNLEDEDTCAELIFKSNNVGECGQKVIDALSSIDVKLSSKSFLTAVGSGRLYVKKGTPVGDVSIQVDEDMAGEKPKRGYITFLVFTE